MTSGTLKHQPEWKIWHGVVFFYLVLGHDFYVLSTYSQLSLSLSLSIMIHPTSLCVSPQHLSNLRLSEAALSHSFRHRLPRLCLHQLCLLSCSWTGRLYHLHGRDTRSASRVQFYYIQIGFPRIVGPKLPARFQRSEA
jgi:hypothetical protein